jgi:hypothetical protein
MHLMIDLETLSLAPNAVVTEIGMVTFDIHTQDLILEQKNWYPDLKLQTVMGRVVDPQTALWWMEQSEAARLNIAKAARLPGIHDMFDDIQQSFDWENIEGIWSHGLNFDVPILIDLYRSFNMKAPWEKTRYGYRNTRDTRTILWLAGIEHKGTAHNAIDDCIAQAKAVQKAFGILSAGLPAGKF